MVVVESGDNIRNGITDKVFGGVSRNRDLMREILDGISNTSGMCIRHVAVDTSIMFHGWTDVPCISTSRSPGESVVGLFMD